jgi:hypothetical protein
MTPLSRSRFGLALNECIHFRTAIPHAAREQMHGCQQSSQLPSSTAKNNREITQAILDNQGFEDAVWIRALDKMIADARSADDGGKSFHLGHVIARMSGTLPSGLAAARKAAKEAELSPLILSLTTFQERRRAIVESAECQARQIAEAEQVEDFLPDETHLWAKHEVAQ